MACTNCLSDVDGARRQHLLQSLQRSRLQIANGRLPSSIIVALVADSLVVFPSVAWGCRFNNYLPDHPKRSVRFADKIIGPVHADLEGKGIINIPLGLSGVKESHSPQPHCGARLARSQKKRTVSPSATVTEEGENRRFVLSTVMMTA